MGLLKRRQITMSTQDINRRERQIQEQYL